MAVDFYDQSHLTRHRQRTHGDQVLVVQQKRRSYSCRNAVFGCTKVSWGMRWPSNRRL